MKTFPGAFTQGGQTELHKFRMLKQVFGTTFKVSLCVAVVSLVVLCALAEPWEAYWNLLVFYKALLRNHLSFLPKGFFDSSWLYWQPGKIFEVSDYQLEHNVKYSASALYVQSVVIKKLFWSFLIWVASFVGLSSFWIFRGSQKHQKKILSGTTLANTKAMVKLIQKKKEASHLHIAGVPLIKDKETEHFLISGTTGSGKTNCFIELLQQIRECGDRAVIVDSTSELFQRFFQEKKDLLLNPLDVRSQNWNLWAECQEKYHFNEFAECLIPASSHHDTFWTNAARDIFVETAKLLHERGSTSYEELMNHSIKKPIKDIAEFYARSSVASMMNIAAEKTSMSIRSTLATAIRCFESLEEGGEFSIRKWMQSVSAKALAGLGEEPPRHSLGEAGWLFLSCQPDQRALLRPLFSGWLAIAVRSLLAGGSAPKSKTWFIIDELPTLNHLPELPKALAEVRKYGGCFVIGLQSVSQLEDIYGRATTQTMSGLTGTKIIFRASETIAAKRMSELLGEQEVMEAVESISFGAHQVRDGVSLSDQKRRQVTIPYTDILQLNNLEAYLKLPGNYPIAKIEFDYHNLGPSVSAFKKRPIVLSPTLDRKALELYGLGMNYKDIAAHLKEGHGVELSLDGFNAIIDKLLPFIEEWRTRNLGAIYPILFVDRMFFECSKKGKVVTKAVYNVLSINQAGHREILGFYVTETEDANFWLGVFNDLRQRGVEDILIACVYDLTGLSSAIEAYFPKTAIQLCIIHQIRNSLKYVANKNQKELMKDLKTVYQANAQYIAVQQLSKLDEKWGVTYPMVIKLWHANWEDLTCYFQYPEEIRKLIYTTALEDFHRQLRKVTKTPEAFSNETALFKFIYCTCQKNAEKWIYPLLNWPLTLYHLDIHFEGRLNLDHF